MPEPMDYVPEALFALNDAEKASTDGMWNRANLKAARAQTFALLALVEQQRIANLIAYYAPDNNPFGGGPGSSGAIDDIEKGLGL